jgi:hypothetical protein
MRKATNTSYLSLAIKPDMHEKEPVGFANNEARQARTSW